MHVPPLECHVRLVTAALFFTPLSPAGTQLPRSPAV